MKAFPRSVIEEDEVAAWLAKFARGEVGPRDMGYAVTDHPAMRGAWVAYDENDPQNRMKLTERALDLLRRTCRADAVSVAILTGRTMSKKPTAEDFEA